MTKNVSCWIENNLLLLERKDDCLSTTITRKATTFQRKEQTATNQCVPENVQAASRACWILLRAGKRGV